MYFQIHNLIQIADKIQNKRFQNLQISWQANKNQRNPFDSKNKEESLYLLNNQWKNNKIY